MGSLFKKLLGINWRSTMAGIASLVTVVGVIVNAWRTKDFGTIFSQGQTVIPIVIGIITGLGFFATKDANVTGVGTQAAQLEDSGKLVTKDDKVVGQQPTT